MFMMKFILRIDYEILGRENIPKAPFIIASNHQSAWETFFFPILFRKSIFILKSELKRIPIFRNYFKKLGFIYVEKEHPIKSLKNLLINSKKSVSSGVNSIIIFPEGTRVSPGEKKELSTGVGALYKNLKIPVLPIRHNSGEYWINKKFVKKKGKIIINIHKPIFPGIKNDVLMKKLKEIYTS